MLGGRRDHGRKKAGQQRRTGHSAGNLQRRHGRQIRQRHQAAKETCQQRVVLHAEHGTAQRDGACGDGNRRSGTCGFCHGFSFL
jgi:hypothetical protein